MPRDFQGRHRMQETSRYIATMTNKCDHKAIMILPKPRSTADFVFVADCIVLRAINANKASNELHDSKSTHIYMSFAVALPIHTIGLWCEFPGNAVEDWALPVFARCANARTFTTGQWSGDACLLLATSRDRVCHRYPVRSAPSYYLLFVLRSCQLWTSHACIVI